MAVTLAQLIAGQTVQQIFQTLLSYYAAAGFPTTAWQSGGTERTRLMAMATALASFSNYIPAVAGGSLLDYSPNYPGWTALTAQEIYNLTPNAAVYTQGTIVATNASTTAYSYAANSLIAVYSNTGNRYFVQGSGTIAASTTTNIVFQAEFAGASYNDPSNSAFLTLVTPLPGVTLTNPSTSYTTVSHVGSGTGNVAASGMPSVSNASVVITITSSGQAGVATWSYSLNGGAAVAAGAVSSLTNLGGTGINVTLTNGSANPSFVLNDTYAFNTPAPWITQQGSNAETDTALAQRCRTRLSSVANVNTSNLYYLLATSVPSVGSQVTQCVVVPDPNINNKVNIIVAGPAGPLPAGVVSSVQTYINPRAGQGDYPVVTTPTTLAITIAGTVTVYAAQYTAASNAITTALNNYIASVGINGTVQLSEIIALIRATSGVVNLTVSSVTINGAAADLTLGGVGSYVMPAYPPTINLSYVTQ